MSDKSSLVIIDGRTLWDAFSGRQKCMAVEMSKYRDVIYLEEGGSLFPKIRRISNNLIVVSGVLRWYVRNFRKPSKVILLFPAVYLNILTARYSTVTIWAMDNSHELLPGVNASIRVFDHIDPCFSDNTDVVRSHDFRVIDSSKKADIVLATASSLLDECRPYNDNCFLVENATTEKVVSDEQLRDVDLVWLGTLDSRIDYDFLLRVEQLSDDLRLVLAGNIHPDYRERVNTFRRWEYWGPLNDEDGDRLMARSKYGVIPYIPGPVSERINPCKIFGYVASGVIPLSLPSSHADRYSEYCLMSNDATYWVNAIKNNIRPVNWQSRKHFVDENTWKNRIEQVNDILRNFRS